MRWEQFTEKARSAINDAAQMAATQQNPEVTPEHLLLALIEQEGGVVAAVLDRLQVDALPLTNRLKNALDRLPKIEGDRGEPALSRQTAQILESAIGQSKFFKDEFVSTEHILAAALGGHGHGGRQGSEGLGAGQGPPSRGAPGSSRLAEGHGSEPGRQVPSAPAVRTRSHADGAPPKVGPGHRSRPGDPAAHADPGEADQEQSRPRGRPGCGKDGHRGRPCPSYGKRRRARVAQGQATRPAGPGLPHRGNQVPRRVRGPPQGRRQGDHRRRGRHPPLHRRASYPRGRGRRRGRHGRRQHPQARPGPGRTPRHRGHHGERIPQAHRKGSRPRTALPAHLRGGAHRGGRHRHPPRTEGAVRGSPRSEDQRRCHRSSRDAEPPLHPRPFSARQGHRPHGRSGGEAAHPSGFASL